APPWTPRTGVRACAPPLAPLRPAMDASDRPPRCRASPPPQGREEEGAALLARQALLAAKGRGGGPGHTRHGRRRLGPAPCSSSLPPAGRPRYLAELEASLRRAAELE